MRGYVFHTSPSSLALASARCVASSFPFTASPDAQTPASSLCIHSEGMTSGIRRLLWPWDSQARILTVENVEEFADCRR